MSKVLTKLPAVSQVPRGYVHIAVQDGTFVSFGEDWKTPCSHTRVLTGGEVLEKDVM